MSLVLGFDLGTGSVRAGVYDVDGGTMLGGAEERYATSFPRPGWAEQQPEAWWTALLSAGLRAVEAAGRREVAAICVAATASTVVACRADGTPVYPAILWMDCRAAGEACETGEAYHPVMAYSGGEDAAEWLVPKAMWLKRHEPEVFARAEVICEAIDYINYRLSGEWAASRMTAACKWNYDSAAGRYVPELYESFGVGALADKLPVRVVPVGAPLGRLRTEIAAELGLASAPLLVQGGIDAEMGMLGAGTTEPGSMLIVAGTSVAHLTHIDEQRALPGFWGPYPNALIDGLWLVEGGQVSAGSILDWLTGTIFGLDEVGHHALIDEAARLSPEETGLMVLDYWMGNRTPYRDAGLRGAVLGLSLGHGRAQIYRAAVDAVALGTINVVRTLENEGVKIERVVMGGGICHNPLWLAATVDALGRPVHLVRKANLSLIGTVASAACGLGLYPDLASASRSLAAGTEAMMPEPERTAWYDAALGRYDALTGTLAPVLHRLSATEGRHR
ncbi:FGGY-family carbohydrate kinase [Chelativorans salis]|uniref:FGGY-family carbohydrate kinase n=1 Tax=Chelativorans salis TaxID=2978478 RepID=A0ABT2LRL6_9HYPH|nr:FGGY-family carbohydrate kinase [Chelativorans sp. EGI FJ00035]MCT7377109.1 FGGY-family carbohydrate kinase [Chelativorans sp. EGI FJ00035]